MPSVFADQRWVKDANEVLLGVANFIPLMASGDTLTGTPTVAVSPSGPTLGTPTKNSTTLSDINGNTLSANQGVQFTVTGGTANTDYVITVTCSTTNGATRVMKINLSVK